MANIFKKILKRQHRNRCCWCDGGVRLHGTPFTYVLLTKLQMIKMPAVIMERSRLSRPMWKALKTHIVRERQRKKQGTRTQFPNWTICGCCLRSLSAFYTEQEADAEVERQRREREDQQKEQEMTLEETKEQVAQSESRLAQLKEDKHQLFLQLKKVLNEDDTRRKIRESNFK